MTTINLSHRSQAKQDTKKNECKNQWVKCRKGSWMRTENMETTAWTSAETEWLRTPCCSDYWPQSESCCSAQQDEVVLYCSTRQNRDRRTHKDKTTNQPKLLSQFCTWSNSQQSLSPLLVLSLSLSLFVCLSVCLLSQCLHLELFFSHVMMT